MGKEYSPGVKSSQSVDKLLSIIEFLANQRTPVRVIDIANGLGMNQSTVLRFLTALIERGYVTQDPETLKYYLTMKLCNVANKITEHMDLRVVAKPYMEKIAEIFNESVCLAIEKDEKAVYIESVDGPNSILRATLRIGKIAPLYCTGVGKLLLFNHSVEDIDRLMHQPDVQSFTVHTITTTEEMLKTLDRAKEEGLAYDNEECEIGARCVAAPVYDSFGNVFAAISVTGPASRLNDSYIWEKKKDFITEVNNVTKKMGGIIPEKA